MNCNATIGAMRTRVVSALALLLVFAVGSLDAAEHPSLAKARALYNAVDFDGAIAAAEVARVDPASADAATLVIARAHLERYRLRNGDQLSRGLGDYAQVGRVSELDDERGLFSSS